MKRGPKTWVVLGIGLGTLTLLPLIHHYWLRAKTKAYLAGLKAQGEPMDLAQVVPPLVLSERNAAPLITNALAQIEQEHNYTNTVILINEPSAMDYAIPGKAIVGWRQPVIHNPTGNFPTNSWEELAAQLADRRTDLNDLRKLIGKPLCDFGYDYSDPQRFAPKLGMHLSAIRTAAEWLAASENYGLHTDHPVDACSDVRALLALVKCQTGERFEISQLIRFAIARRCATATWEILQATNVSDENLEQLQRDWQSLEFLAPFKDALLFERVSFLRLEEGLRDSPTNLDAEVNWTRSVVMTPEDHSISDEAASLFQRMKNGLIGKWNEFQRYCFWSYTDEMRGSQMWQTVIEGTENLRTNRSFQSAQLFVTNDFEKLGFDSAKQNPYAIISQNAYSQIGTLQKEAQAETVRNIAVTAIALKRYELRHQRLPDSLTELVPDFLGSVPTDYMDGQPLRYHWNNNGTFLLYSVGENGKDDGGNPGWEKDTNTQVVNPDWLHPHLLDWVWPQPATPAEVQNYYEHPPK